MDGHIAPLAEICALAKQYDALTFVDECHATGFVGATGRGTDEHCGVHGQVDIINSTLGKAMGGATGGRAVRGKCEVPCEGVALSRPCSSTGISEQATHSCPAVRAEDDGWYSSTNATNAAVLWSKQPM